MHTKAGTDPVPALHARESEKRRPGACHGRDIKLSYDERLFTT